MKAKIRLRTRITSVIRLESPQSEVSLLQRYVFHNDRIVTLEDVRLSPGQGGLLSGWGLFTTLRVFRGQPFAFERHWRRLEKDAGRTRLPFPFVAQQVRHNLGELLLANQVVEGTARIYLIYNQVGNWRSDEAMPQVDLLLCSSDLPSHPELARLSVAAHARHAASALAGVKSTSWLNNVWNLAEAQREGWTEVVLLNERGEVAECTTANIFCVKNGAITTPPLSSGCLEGVTRSILLEIAPVNGVPITERTLFPDDLYSADEVFITSTNRSLLGVKEIAGHGIAGAPGPITEKLETAFLATMEEYVGQRR